MNRNALTSLLVALIVFIALVNTTAEYYHLYYLIWWLDIPMHILGGVWVALMSLYLYYKSGWFKRKDHAPFIVMLIATATVLVAGLGWEIYEFALDRAFAVHEIRLGDSLKDLVDDLLGGGIGALYFIKKKYHQHI